MFVASYRNTISGARAIMAKAAKQEQELSRQDLINLRNRQRREAEEAIAKARADMVAAEKRAAGIRHRRSFAQIERLICKAFQVTRNDLRSERRSKHVVKARQALCYWACRLTRLSLPQIGKLIGRDHTTVLHAKVVYVEKRRADGRNLRVVR